MNKIYRFNGFILWLAILILTSSACQRKAWDDYYKNPDSRTGSGVFQTIAANPNYSEFTALLRKSGLDSLITASGQFTVLVVKNGALGAIDMNNTALVKKVMDMHVLPLAISKTMMNNYNVSTMMGKTELLNQGYVSIKAGAGKDSVRIVNGDVSVSNGIIHEVERYIIPRDNLLDAIAGNSDYSMFYNYILSTRAKLLDPKLSTIIGYDSLSQAVYDSVFTFRYAFFDAANLSDESGAYTIFVPKNDLVSRILNTDIHVPWGGAFSYSTFFSSLIKDRLFKSCIVKGIYKLSDLQDINSLKTTSGMTIKLLKSQIGVADQKASNGVYHILNNIDIPDYICQVPIVTDGYVSYATRPSKGLIPDEIPLANIANGSALLSQQLPNKYNNWFAYHFYYFNTSIPPVLQWRVNLKINGTSGFWYPYNFNIPSGTGVAALTGSAITFTLPAKYSAMSANAGLYAPSAYRIDFVGTPGTSKATINTFSALPRGWYNVILNTQDTDDAGIFDVSYGSTVLLANFNASNPQRNRPAMRQNITLGPIFNPGYGKIPITFTLKGGGLNGKFLLQLDAILFTAVPEP